MTPVQNGEDTSKMTVMMPMLCWQRRQGQQSQHKDSNDAQAVLAKTANVMKATTPVQGRQQLASNVGNDARAME
jgi:hypothetical protein